MLTGLWCMRRRWLAGGREPLGDSGLLGQVWQCVCMWGWHKMRSHLQTSSQIPCGFKENRERGLEGKPLLEQNT